MNRMTEIQRDTLAEMLEGIASDGPTGLSLDAALDAIAETVLPSTISRYFEAHITLEPDGEHTYEEFEAVVSEFCPGWKTSRFEDDSVDQIAGKWFMSARNTSYTSLLNDVRGTVHSFGAAGTDVLRWKIEETLIDSKCGDKL